MQHQGLCCVCHSSLASKQARVCEGLRGDTAETAELKWPKGYSIQYGVLFSWGKEEWRGMFRAMVFAFPRNHYSRWALLSWKWLHICLPNGDSEGISCFALLVYTAFALPLSLLSLSQLLSSHIFAFLILSPPGEGEQAAVRCWAACQC